MSPLSARTHADSTHSNVLQEFMQFGCNMLQQWVISCCRMAPMCKCPMVCSIQGVQFCFSIVDVVNVTVYQVLDCMELQRSMRACFVENARLQFCKDSS